MVPCVFSRRNKSRRKKSTKSLTSKQECIQNDGESSGLPHAPCSNPPQLDSKTTGGTLPLAIELSEPERAYPDVSNDKLVFGGTLDDGSSTDNTTMDDLWLFNNDTTLSIQETTDNGVSYSEFMPSLTSMSEENISSNGSTIFEAYMMLPERGAATKELLSLASNLHENLELLSNGKWQQEEACLTLDDYPIGTIVHLSQEFITLGTALQKTRPCMQASASIFGAFNPQILTSWPSEYLDFSQLGEESACSASSESTTPALAPFDPSVAFMLLSCFMSLTRIHSMVLVHFRNYLNLQPNIQADPSHPNLDLRPTIRLGELLPISSCCNRVHTTIILLVYLFEQAEAAMGLPLKVAVTSDMKTAGSCNLETNVLGDVYDEKDFTGTNASWDALTSASGIHEARVALKKQVADIKDLVREKLGL